MNEGTTLSQPLFKKVDRVLRTKTDRANVLFNNCSSRTRKIIAIIFGLSMASICFALILKSLINEVNTPIQVSPIAKPLTIPMETIQDAIQLIPLGKMKGEINGEFEAFYVALDKNGSIYINRSLGYRRDAYNKSNNWESITREQLEVYESQLHFLPISSKGLKRR